ncbi:hypothetical protein GCM10009127_03280 [Alteraurantiacibacter aestuarii]|uniref:Uncharacterized protein n=1 Tax=Alteraurantiacibacter aestuarii TaxID=650004 RepID=A0A844ZKW9_9SPHN|nr:hypothetical protein [Alteraurantiacibacter aestuarii]MXO88418.1 hypothetical protein [Alteraurantiacibacter aestuarii]
MVQSFKERMKDHDYGQMHLLAISLMQSNRKVPWYDAHFLRSFEIAKQYLQLVRPDRLDEFIAGFAPIRTPADFTVKKVRDLFPGELQAEMRAIVAGLKEQQLEKHELASFGRHVVHDHPFFLDLQRQILPRVSELAGQEVEAGYNFLSLYGNAGRCEPHMDEPVSMYTLDYCIDQEGDWPIYFSRVVDWPGAAELQNWNPEEVLRDPSMDFRAEVIQPNEAILFAGSSQWHYRKAMPPGGYCNLLFFHYFPAGCSDLITPTGWARYFDIPEMEPLCDLFADFYSVSAGDQ